MTTFAAAPAPPGLDGPPFSVNQWQRFSTDRLREILDRYQRIGRSDAAASIQRELDRRVQMGDVALDRQKKLYDLESAAAGAQSKRAEASQQAFKASPLGRLAGGIRFGLEQAQQFAQTVPKLQAAQLDREKFGLEQEKFQEGRLGELRKELSYLQKREDELMYQNTRLMAPPSEREYPAAAGGYTTDEVFGGGMGLEPAGPAVDPAFSQARAEQVARNNNELEAIQARKREIARVLDPGTVSSMYAGQGFGAAPSNPPGPGATLSAPGPQTPNIPFSAAPGAAPGAGPTGLTPASAPGGAPAPAPFDPTDPRIRRLIELAPFSQTARDALARMGIDWRSTSTAPSTRPSP